MPGMDGRRRGEGWMLGEEDLSWKKVYACRGGKMEKSGGKTRSGFCFSSVVLAFSSKWCEFKFVSQSCNDVGASGGLRWSECVVLGV